MHEKEIKAEISALAELIMSLAPNQQDAALIKGLQTLFMMIPKSAELADFPRDQAASAARKYVQDSFVAKYHILLIELIGEAILFAPFELRKGRAESGDSHESLPSRALLEQWALKPSIQRLKQLPKSDERSPQKVQGHPLPFERAFLELSESIVFNAFDEEVFFQNFQAALKEHFAENPPLKSLSLSLHDSAEIYAGEITRLIIEGFPSMKGLVSDLLIRIAISFAETFVALSMSDEERGVITHKKTRTTLVSEQCIPILNRWIDQIFSMALRPRGKPKGQKEKKARHGLTMQVVITATAKHLFEQSRNGSSTKRTGWASIARSLDVDVKTLVSFIEKEGYTKDQVRESAEKTFKEGN